MSLPSPSALSARLRVYPLRLLRAPGLLPRMPSHDRRPGQTALAIEGLVCGLCAGRAQDALAAVPGVDEARVDLRRGVVELRHAQSGPPDARALTRALDGVVVARRVRLALAALAALAARASGGALK